MYLCFYSCGDSVRSEPIWPNCWWMCLRVVHVFYCIYRKMNMNFWCSWQIHWTNQNWIWDHWVLTLLFFCSLFNRLWANLDNFFAAIFQKRFTMRFSKVISIVYNAYNTNIGSRGNRLTIKSFVKIFIFKCVSSIAIYFP